MRQVVEQIYENELTSVRKVMMLEVSQYLELYLWKHYKPSSSQPDSSEASSLAHLMSIMVMINEKFRERVPAWEVRCCQKIAAAINSLMLKAYYSVAPNSVSNDCLHMCNFHAISYIHLYYNSAVTLIACILYYCAVVPIAGVNSYQRES